MASFNRQTCQAAILFLLVASISGSSSGTSLRGIHSSKARNETSRVEAIQTSTTTPANLVETSTESVDQSGTLFPVYPSSSENPLPESQEKSQNRTNTFPSEDTTSSLPTRISPEYQQHHHEVSTMQPGRKDSPQRNSQNNKKWVTSTPNPMVEEETEESTGLEREGSNGTFHTKDLLVPVPPSVALLAQLMSLSMQNLDTAFRGTLNNQSPVVQYAQSFRTTLLQISQKLSNAFLVSTINADKIKMHSLFVPSKVKEATGYLEKLENSSRMVEFLYLPLKNLKETTDQTFNLSSQIATQFGELFQLVGEVIKSHNSVKSIKEQQERNASDELKSTNHQKKSMESEIIYFENEIKKLKEQKQWDASAFQYALDDLKHLHDKEADESQCYWRYNWDWNRTYSWICPNKPDPSEIQRFNQTARAARNKLERTMQSLSLKEEEAARKREYHNELSIRIERLNHIRNQLNEDMQLLRNTAEPLSQLLKNFKKLDKSWNEFASICGKVQSGTLKSLQVIEEANRTSTHWNNQHSENVLFILNKTKEDLSLVKTVIDNYLEGSSNHISEIVAEVEQMMTKTENPGDLERLREKCNTASREIQNLTGSDQGQIKTKTSKKNQRKSEIVLRN